MLAASALVARSQLSVLYRKVKSRFLIAELPVPYALRSNAELPPDGETISVECALNSRCSSDDDGHQEIFHWGRLDRRSRLGPDLIGRVAGMAAGCLPGDTGNTVEIDQDVLTFLVDTTAMKDLQRTRMIYSGMQQQAAGLACAALGIGITFQGQGLDGHQVSSGRLQTVRIQLGAMKASYGPRFWTSNAPTAELPLIDGSLPVPNRNGTRPLLATLSGVRQDSDGRPTTIEDLGQLLWAARGRTPHLYKSKPWGLTVPTWQGLQNITSVSVATDSRLWHYINWSKGRPAHDVELSLRSPEANRWLRQKFSTCNCFILLCTREPHARALWETGYELLNVLLQANALQVAYHTIILAETDRVALTNAINEPGNSSTTHSQFGLPTPVAVIALHAAHHHLFAEQSCSVA